MRISTQAGPDTITNQQAALRVRSALRGGGLTENHNEAFRMPRAQSARTAAQREEALRRRSMGSSSADSEALQVRAALKAGGASLNHNEGLIVRTALEADGPSLNHNPMIRLKPDRRVAAMRGPLCPARRREDQLELVAQPVPRTGFARRLEPGYTRF